MDEKEIFKFSKWEYHGLEIAEDKEDYINCDLCGKSGLKYQFKIIHKDTGEIQHVGSECISKYDVRVRDINGTVLSGKALSNKLKLDKKQLIKKKEIDYVVSCLLKLLSKNDKFFNKDTLDNFISYYLDRGAFTPKQYHLVISKFKHYNISYKESLFKMTIKRKREKEQLFTMQKDALLTIFFSIPKNQQEWMRKNSCEFKYISFKD